MQVTIGTFNLNNLFSRFNFEGAIEALATGGGEATGVTISYEFTTPDSYRIRTFRGELIRAKKPKDTDKIAGRIREMDVDVLAVQEVEDIDVLRQFNADLLGGRYGYQVLIEGNDPRFIDVGILSKLPLRAITSFQTEIHDDSHGPVFGRDLLEAEVWTGSRSRKLFTIYNNHLKSKFVPRDEDQAEGTIKADARRRQQAETIARVVAARQRPDGRFIIVGDMNDDPQADALAPMVGSQELHLVNALASPTETRPPKADTSGPGPQTTAWSYRHKESGEDAQYLLYDQIWLSRALEDKLVEARIDRRKLHGGDGSDHDPCWITLDV